jgi:hypothetical protein
VDERKPVWTSSSFLVYAGGLTVLGSALAALGYLAGSYGRGAFAAWSLLVLAVLYAIAHAFKRRGRWLTAGVFAFTSVVSWGVFVGALWVWFGWLSSDSARQLPFHGFSVARLSLELLVLVAAFDDRRRFEFPFITSILVLVGWLFVTDLVSGGGAWSAIATLAVGLVYLVAGAAGERPSAFWLHLAAGVLIGGSLLYWWHAGDLRWALIGAASVVYVALAGRTSRSSWAVLGAFGLLAASTHFAQEWARGNVAAIPFLGVSGFHYRAWVPPLVFAVAGFLLVALGLALARRRSPV